MIITPTFLLNQNKRLNFDILIYIFFFYSLIVLNFVQCQSFLVKYKSRITELINKIYHDFFSSITITQDRTFHNVYFCNDNVDQRCRKIKYGKQRLRNLRQKIRICYKRNLQFHFKKNIVFQHFFGNVPSENKTKQTFFIPPK